MELGTLKYSEVNIIDWELLALITSSVLSISPLSDAPIDNKIDFPFLACCPTNGMFIR